jgi:hypothetical protein
MECRVLESKRCAITQGANNTNHIALDLVKEGYMLDYIVAHSDGTIIALQDGLGNMKGTNSYGNYVKIDHGNGYCTLYAHMQKGLPVKSGQFVKAGQRLGYMSDSGNAYGGHLHWEVWKNGSRINPTEYLNKDFTSDAPSSSQYKVGDTVTINGVYVSSTSTEKLTPAITKGTITKIVEGARNPYLLDNGNIGWINDGCIVSTTAPKKKSIDEVAKDVINGNYGNQPERQKRLEAEGYNYREVQNRVNQLLK